MHQTFEELGFKAGDKVKCIKTRFDIYDLGKIYTIIETDLGLGVGNGNDGFCGSWELVTDNKEKESGMFVETKTVKTIKKSIHVREFGAALVSVVPTSSDEIQLVIGADWKDRCASYFNKQALQRLVDSLQEVADAMD